MQINLIIQSFIHLFKEMFIVYFIGGSEVGKEINVSVKSSMGSMWWGTER